MLSPESIQKFRELYEARYGVLLSEEEAGQRALRLINLFRAVYKPENEIVDKNDEFDA